MRGKRLIVVALLGLGLCAASVFIAADRPYYYPTGLVTQAVEVKGASFLRRVFRQLTHDWPLGLAFTGGAICVCWAAIRLAGGIRPARQNSLA